MLRGIMDDVGWKVKGRRNGILMCVHSFYFESQGGEAGWGGGGGLTKGYVGIIDIQTTYSIDVVLVILVRGMGWWYWSMLCTLTMSRQQERYNIVRAGNSDGGGTHCITFSIAIMRGSAF